MRSSAWKCLPRDAFSMRMQLGWGPDNVGLQEQERERLVKKLMGIGVENKAKHAPSCCMSVG